MNYNRIKFEIYLNENLILTLKNSIERFLSEYESNTNFYFLRDHYKDSLKLEFSCSKDYAFEIISLIKNFSHDIKIDFNIFPIIN